MNDDRVSRALKSLPREQAGMGFTPGVLRRIEEAPSRFLPAWWAPMRWTPLRWTGVAATAVLVLALGLGWRQWRDYQTAEKLQVLLAEKQELEMELAALRQITAEARPVVYLGSDDEVDLVLDLARFKRQGGFGSNPPISPVPAANLQAREQTVRPLRVVY